MMTVEQMKVRKQEMGYSYAQIAALSGVPVGTVQKVLSGITKAPRHETLQALEKAFEDTHSYHPEEKLLQTEGVRESASAYQAQPAEKRQGEYTLKDYYALPDERRVELIDGVIYDMAAPSSVHQLISAEICHMLRNEIEKRNGSCLPFAAPVDVQLDCDDRTMVQPDVLVICDRSKVIQRCIYGAPELIIEILSPSTRKKDMQLKAYKYANAGVREYWLIDPDAKKVLVYDFEHEAMPAVYGFDAQIPVTIFGADFIIDFSKVHEYIAFLYELE